jgi:hypothetical protein
MKKISIALLIVSGITACHKNNTAAYTGSGFWTMAGKQYNANYVTRKDTAGMILLLAQDTLASPSHPSNSIAFLFSAPPADSVLLQVVWEERDTVLLPGPGQISIFGTRNESDTCGPVTYYVGPYDNVSPWTLGPGATVKVVNGKMNVSIPTLYTGLFNACYYDSMLVSAHIQER